MEYIGIDVHQRESQVGIDDERGQVLIERRVRTSREQCAALFGARAGRACCSRRRRRVSGLGGARRGKAGSRGDRGGSELRADVRQPQPAR
jgi:hypothetical protein